MARSIPSTLSLRSLVFSLVAAYLLLAMGLRAAQAIAPVPDGTLIEVVRDRVSGSR